MGANSSNAMLPAERFAKGVPEALDWASLMDVLFQPCHQAVLLYTSDEQAEGPAPHLPRKRVQVLRSHATQAEANEGPFPVGMVSQKGNKMQPNQDCAFYFHFVDSDGSHIWCACVLDGHGPLGHEMSSLGMQWLPLLLLREPLLATEAGRLIPSDPQTVFSAVQAAFRRIGDLMRKASETGWGPRGYSGATCTLALCAHGLLHTANVGDSRMILGSFPASSPRHAGEGEGKKEGAEGAEEGKREGGQKEEEEFAAECRVLTRDHKPEDPDERLRIEQQGGIVARQRVYLDEWPYVGLNMSRSLGDAKLHAVGVSPVPDVATVFLENAGNREAEEAEDAEGESSRSPQTQFLVAASDGVWDFTGCEEVAHLVGRHLRSPGAGGLEEVAAALVQHAQGAWEAECPDLDDITAIVVAIDTGRRQDGVRGLSAPAVQ